MNEKIEYRVRPVTRYLITRFHQEEYDNGRCSGGCEERGEFDNPDIAYNVAYALALKDRDDLGWAPGDDRMQFPEHPTLKRQISKDELHSLRMAEFCGQGVMSGAPAS